MSVSGYRYEELIRRVRPASCTQHLAQRNFFPAVRTLALNTGLPRTLLMPWNGFITAFTQASYTSVKNNRSASSVCGLAGFVGIVAVFPDEEEVEARANSDEGGVVVVYGANGGKMC